MTEWLSFRASFLDELLRHDGRADYKDNSSCFTCLNETTLYKCRDCFRGSLLRCQECIVESHGEHPLHRIEVRDFSPSVLDYAKGLQLWNGSCFSKTTLKDLGLRIQLGHGGAACGCPLRSPLDFNVIDVTGFHLLAIDFCDCRRDGILHRRTQLLHAGWFPATFNRPQTVFTFNILSMFHELTLQGKTTVYDFYYAIVHLNDNAGLGSQPVSFMFLFIFLSTSLIYT